MHELSVCIALLEQVQNVAQDRGAKSVTKIILQLGPLAGIEPELLRHAYPLAAAGTLAENAQVVIQAQDVVIHCAKCGNKSHAEPNNLVCPRCGDYRTRLLQGDEMILQTIELQPFATPATAH